MNKTHRPAISLLLIVLSLFVAAASALAQPLTSTSGIIYVRPTVFGDGTGSSWGNATNNLHDAIHASNVQKVFVAVGTYPVGDHSFVMKNGVEIYGGFDPTNDITTLAHNRILPNKGMGDGSVLDGENIRPVVWNDDNGLTNSAVLDGFTIMRGNGSGIYNGRVSPVFNNLVIRNNYKGSSGGGGMENYVSSPVMTNVVFQDNLVNNGAGGAIYNTSSTVTITNAVFKGNQTPQATGTVMYNFVSSSATLTNVLITGNNARSSLIAQATGGAITLNNVSIANNTGSALSIGSGTTATINNSIIFGGVSGSHTSQYSFIQGNTDTNNGNINTTGLGIANIFTNPSAGDYTLKSPAVINKGNNALYPTVLDANTKDLAGNARLIGTNIDLGAYEYPYSIVPDADGIVYVRQTATGDGSGSDWNNATADLHNAIHTVNVQKVFVGVGNYNVGDHSFIMKNGVEIYGGFDPASGITDLGHNRIMPDAANNALGSVLNGQSTRPVIWNFNNDLNATAVLDGFNIANGSYTNGGGIVNVGSSPTYRNLVIRGNNATVSGGGMHNYASSPNIINTVFKNNSVLSHSGTAVYGGAIYNTNASAPILINVNIIANVVSSSGTEGGAGIYNNNSNPKIYNSILWNNIKQHTGGGAAGSDIESSGGTLTLKNSITQSYTTGNNADNNLVNINPNFQDVNSGNYRLQVSSPAMDAGDNTFYSDLDANPKDLAGNPRLSSEVIDIGAYEYQLNITPTDGIVYVRPTASGARDGSSWANATNNLQGAINATGVQKVFVAIGNYNVPLPNSFAMKKDVAIYGGFDPENHILTLDDERILPNKGTSEGSVLNGQNAVSVIDNTTVDLGLAATAILDGFTIKNGNSNLGGGIMSGRGSGSGNWAVFRNLVIKNNTAAQTGGGVYVFSSIVNLTNVIVKNNTAAYAGGLYIFNASDQSLTNVQITDNIATDKYGGLAADALSLLTNVTIANNTSPNSTDNGIFGIDFSYPKLRNSIVFGGYSLINHSTDKNQYSLIENNSETSYGNLNATGIALTDIFTDPANGDYTIKSSSVINKGNNALYPTVLDANTKDLAGNVRLVGTAIDLGAYEFPYPVFPDADGIIYVKPTATGNGNGSSWEHATTDLHNAIHAPGVQQVFVAMGTYNVGNHSFIMKNGVAIYGGFDPDQGIRDLSHQRIMPHPAEANQGSVLNGQTVRPVIWNVFNSGTVMDNTAVLDGFRLTGGKYTNGAGIRNVYASPTLRNLVITSNTATVTGAGIYNEHSSPLLSNSVISNNTVLDVNPGAANVFGAGVYNKDASAPVLTNVTITENGLRVIDGSLTMKGAGMYNHNSSPTVYNSIIWNNHKSFNVSLAGADFENEGSSSLTLKNSITQGYDTESAADNNKVGVNPLFVNAGSRYYNLQSASPARDAGSEVLFTDLDGSTRDLAGNPRVAGAGIDMGAYEFAFKTDADGVIYVKPAATGLGDGSSWENATGDLHNAIHAEGAQKVFVAIGDYPVGDHSFVMKNEVEIYGGFDPGNGIRDLSHDRILPNKGMADGSVLNGQDTRPVIWNEFTAETALHNTAILDGFTVMGGRYAGEGAGIRNLYASPVLNNLVVRNNHSNTWGAGIYNESGSPSISNTVIQSNTCNMGTAGMWNRNANAVITNVRITGNTGGMYIRESSPILTNVLIDNNTTAGLHNHSGNGIFTNVTLIDNGANFYADGYTYWYNSIIWDNISLNNFEAKYALIKGRGDTSNGNVDASNTTVNRIFTDPANGDYSLRMGSLGINTGSNSLFAGLDADMKDLAGNARVFDFADGGIIDMGALESTFEKFAPDEHGIIYVSETPVGDGTGKDWENATDNLNDAIHLTGVQQVFVATGNYNTDSRSFVMKNGVALYGGFDPDNGIRDLSHERILPLHGTLEGSVLNGQNQRPVIWNVFNASTAIDNTAILDGFTLKNGDFNSEGAGIRNVYASPVLTNLWITNNSSPNGAGIYNNNSSPKLTNILIADNSGDHAGMYSVANSEPLLTNVTIIDDIYGVQPASVSNSILYGNVAGGYHAQYSLIKGHSSTSDGNLSANGIALDAIFTDPANRDYSLLKSSPAINAGSNALFAGLHAGSRDLAGNARVFDLADEGIIDIGALESSFTSVNPDANGVLYVNKNHTGGNESGISWDHPIPELSDALKVAATNSNVREIWVAKGTYRPLYAPAAEDSDHVAVTAQDNTFLLVRDVKIYGGFDPENGLLDMDTRDPQAARTVLSGDLGIPLAETDNAYHVVLSVGDVGTAELNGFTISGGYAFGGVATLPFRTYNLQRYLGAGLYLVESSPIIAEVRVSNNISMAAGAGMYLAFSNSILTNVRVSGNTTYGNGGGMLNANSSPVLTNVLIDNNSASGRGGGMENGVSNPVLTNVTIADNTGGGMVNTSGSSPLIRNSIIYGNTSYNIWNTDVGINHPVFNHSLLQASGGSDAWDGSTGNVDGGQNIDLDPLFMNAAHPTVANRDYRLQTGSPALDIGDNSLYYMGSTPDLFAITIDLDGNPRISEGVIDMGAYELLLGPPVVITPDANGIVYVRTTAHGTGDGSSWEDATANLQGAIQSGASQVYVASGTYNVPASINGFVMKNGVAIYGGFDPDNGIRVLGDDRIPPSTSVLQGSILHGLNAKSVIRNAFAPAAPLDHTAMLDGFTLTKGLAADGGGMYNEYASPTLTNLLLLENKATNRGGGLFNSNSAPLMDRITILGNTADNQGGGIYTGRADDFNMSNILIKGNLAEEGGGIYHFDTHSTLVNVVLASNMANGSNTGSAFHGYSGSNHFINSTFARNPGNTFYNGATAELDNTILFGGTDGLAYTARHSLIEGNTNLTNGNLDAAGLDIYDVFKDPNAGDYSLSPTSEAVNTGNNTLFFGLDANVKDLAGNSRLFGTTIDLGAYELQEAPVITITPDTDGIIYVRPSVAGTGRGNDWANATADLQGAINSGATTVFVAIGQYDAPAAASFAMKNGVAIYGGFDPEYGIEELDDERILPNVGSDDGSVLVAQNGYPVIDNNSLSNTAVLDGFTITGGNNTDYGGGIVNNFASPVLKNLVIKDNHVLFDGGAIYNYASSPTLTHVILSGNSAMFGGAMSNWDDSNPVLINAVLSKNSASLEGGAIYNFMSSPQLINSVIAGNDAPDGSALHNNFGTTSQILNSIIHGNTGGAVIVNTDPSADIPVYKHSLVEGSGGSSAWESAFGVDGGNNIDVNPLFTDADAGNYTLQMGSPAINAGDNTLFPDLDVNTKDLGGNPRLSGVAIDMGAYEAQGLAQTIDPISDMVMEYGDADFEPGATASSGLAVSYSSADHTIAEAYQDAADGNKWKITIKKAGTVTITASQSGGGSYMAAPDVVFDLTVNKREVQVSFTNDQVSKVYDGNVDGNITIAHLQFGAGNVVGGDDLEIVLNADAIVFDNQHVGTDKLITLPLASIGLAGVDLENYILGNNANLTAAIGAISPADLTVTVDAGQGKIYGDAEPPLTYLAAGFLGADDENILTGSLERAAGEDVGIYTIGQGSLDAGDNYTIIFTGADFEITKADITGVTFPDGSFVYDGTEKTLVIVGTLPAGIDAGANVSYTIDGVVGNGATDAGTYDLVATIDGSTNYNDLVLNAELEITKADITGVTFTDGSFVYDGTEKTLAIVGTLPAGTSVSYTNNGRTDVGSQTVTATITGGTNYNDLVLNAELEITVTKSDITGITFVDGSFGYDGTEKTLSITGTLPVGTSVSYLNNGRTELGSQTVTANISGGVNYNDLTLFADLTIVKGTITGITFTDGSFVYDGTEMTLAISGTLPDGIDAGADVHYTIDGAAGNGATDAGTYDLVATITGGANYNDLILNAELEITKAAITGITFDDDSFVYDGTEKTLAISGTLPAGTSVSYTIDGIAGNEATDAGTYDLVATITGGANYNDLILNAELEITKATITGVTFDDASFVYDGTEKTLAISGTLPAGTSVSYTIDGAAGNGATDVGTYNLVATITGGANYNNLILNAELEITKATMTGVTFTDGIFGYDGTEKTLAISGTLPAGTSVSYTIDGAAGNGATDVGTYNLVATITGGANYNNLILNAELEITKADITGITFTDGSFVYDGTEKTLAIAGTLPTGTSVSYTNNGRTDVGSQTVTATISGGANYNDLILDAILEITITKSDITGITFTDGSFGYDGTEKIIEISGTLPVGTSVSYVNNGRTELGSQTVTANISGGVNYNDLTLFADLTIVKGTITGVTFADGSFVYDGTEKTLAISGTLPAGIDSGADVHYTINGVAGNGATDVGIYDLVATITGGANYNDLILHAELEITKATITGVTFTDGSFVYDGTEKTLTIAGTLPAGTSVSYTIDGAAGNGATDAGTYDLVATITGGANYNDLVLNAELGITKANITGVTFTDGSFVYDGTEKTLAISGTPPTGANVSYIIDGNAGNGATDVGTYHLTATITGGANYNDLVLNAELEITKATITGVTFTDGSFIYDGTEKTLTIAGTLPAGVDAGADVHYTIDGAAGNGATDVGTYHLTATIAGGTNYNDLVLNAELEITKADITGVTFTDGSFVYDGTERTLEITGTLPTGASVSYTIDGNAGNGATDVGTYHLTATITGGTNYNGLVLNASLEITSAKSDITGITFTNGSFAYDGTQKTLAITGTLPTGASISYTNNGRTEPGSQTVTATITGGTNYNDLILFADLTIVKGTITGITFTDGSFVYDGTEKTLTITGTLPTGTSVSYTIDGNAGNGATDIGTYHLTATITGDNYQTLVLSADLTITSQERTLTFPTLPAKVFGDPVFAAGAGSSTGEQVIYSSSNPAVAEVIDGFIHIRGAGTTTITVTLPENSNYSNNPVLSLLFTVSKAAQTITHSMPSQVNRNIGQIPLTVTSSSGLPVTLEVDDTQIATIEGNMLLIHRLGTIRITATQAGDANYHAATPVTIVIEVQDLTTNKQILIHPALSPNGDGINDVMMIEGIRNYPQNKVTIFNHNSTIVYEAEGYNNTSVAFSGRDRNQRMLPNGTYFYIVEIKDGSTWKVYKGYIVLRN